VLQRKGRESALQDLILEVKKLANEKHLGFNLDIIGLLSDTPGLEISSRKKLSL
jgi:hypothetical protein